MEMSLSPLLITRSGITTTYLPLSTAYPSQASCSSLFINSADQLFAFDPSYGAPNSGPACLPPEATRWWEQDTDPGLTTSTAIGGYKMVCPQAYKTVAMSVLDESSTRVGCCPSAYNFIDWSEAPSPFQCNSPLSTQVVTYMQTDASGTWTTTSSSVSAETSVWGIQVNGILFARPTPTATSSVTSSTSLSSTDHAQSSSGGSGLEKDAKIGIGIGAATAFLLLGAVFVVGMVFWRKRKGKTEKSGGQNVVGAEHRGEEKKADHSVKVEATADSTRHVGMG
ncbi:hypothetical protein LZ554_000649 [Drepanopeziza brunnea f. sp. 'monogermtubi']|nr:hypothetical protein LZ554_000649 [Drepanopeziza brunnea f. sp. 'monogermtubi']